LVAVIFDNIFVCAFVDEGDGGHKRCGMIALISMRLIVNYCNRKFVATVAYVNELFL